MKPHIPLSIALASALAACQPAPPTDTAAETAPATTAPAATTTPPEPAAPLAPAAGTSPPLAQDPAQQAALAGYGDMKLGSTSAEAKAAWGGELKPLGNDSDTCHYLVPKWAKDGKELAFMIENDRFVRYDVGSTKEAAPGGGKVGMTVEALQALYRNELQATPHKYVEGAQYLAIDTHGVAPTRLVFETDAAHKVIGWRVGLSPQVDYVEGCS